MYKYTSKLFIIFFVLLFSIQVTAENKALAKLFAEKGVNGTIVISALQNGQTIIHNNSRANYRFVAASTFKVLNTLISLEEKAISGKNSVFKWDGHISAIANWNQDQTLESAFKVSCVWCYQELARRVGIEKYRNYLQALTYGELYEPLVETTFWLDGSLKISAIEQVEFLKKVYKRTLPFSKSSYETLRQIMIVEQNSTFTIRAKTGLAVISNPKIGWYVGYVETPKNVWFFAMNIDVHEENELPLRLELTQAALQKMGIIE